ncbi:MAG: Stk1 family PASTA domain-containing Ser/Thr kinase [Lachnospiraceae bacterium]|nr:Stk1 family PASTA domain-containing Ser/Thr kinase [Lachnospiraceae bacterium]
MVKTGMMISDRYEIIDRVGAGGMADVYKAMDHRLNRFVAIKVLKQEYSSDAKFVSKFRAEAQSVAGLSHSNIVGVYDVGDENDLYYIVMELVEGITLKRYIERKGKLEIREALGIAIQIAQGLEAAHDNHIIHRDIKPQNIIISREGRVKVTDFGIAKATSSNTITSNAMGSVHYISPEQARGGFSDEKSDIYSLGITMYEMLSGGVPFSGDSTVAIALAHIQEEAVPLSTLLPEIPNGVEMIVSKCMQKKQELRYKSASDLINDLKHALSDPDGDFVKIEPLVDNGSPTKHVSDEELASIRRGTKKIVVTESDDNDLDLSDIEKETENEQEIDPKLEKAVIIGSIVAGVILALIVIFIVIKVFFTGGSTNEESNEVMPTATVAAEATASPEEPVEEGDELDDLADMSKQQAMNYLNELDVEVSIMTEERPSDVIEKGSVISTNPVAGSLLKDGDTVTLIISSGPEAVPVVDVTEYSVEDAKKALEDAGFTTKVDYAYSDTVEIEKVIGTNPEKATEVVKGELITIIVSKGKETKYGKVPNLTGMTKKQAKQALEKQGLKLGTVTSNYSDSVAEGGIISQSQSKGTELEEGTPVDITVSLGPEVTYRYEGSITISDNPFADDTQSGTIKFVLSQDGASKVVGSGETQMDYYSFPVSLTVDGWSESEGEIIMYVNGVRYNAYSISFTKVAQ